MPASRPVERFVRRVLAIKRERHRKWGRWLPSVMLLLAACQNTPAPEGTVERAIEPQESADATDFGPPPEDWQEQVRNLASKEFVDSSSLRAVAISQPFKITVPTWQGPPRNGWMVCLKADGKNQLGAYAGVQIIGYFFENGHLTDSIGPIVSADHKCRAEKYTGFHI